MNEFEPRTHLPDDWARKASCPVCRSHGMHVSHTDGPNDRMVCPTCQVTFEIAQDFTHLRLTRLPRQYITQRIDLIHTWITPVELTAIVDQTLSAAKVPNKAPTRPIQPVQTDPKSILSGLPKLTQEEVNHRARNLLALGNTQPTIKEALERAGATPEQVEVTLDELSRVSKEKEKQQTALFWVITAVVGVLLVVIILWVALGANLPGVQPDGTADQPTTTPLYFKIPQLGGHPTPTSAMPADAQAYFNALFSLQGDFLQRADKLKTMTPPDGLQTIHQTMLDDYTRAGNTQKTADSCLQKIEACNLATPGTKAAEGCQNISQTCSDLSAQANAAHNELTRFVTVDGCSAWQDYYSNMNEPWPLSGVSGGCRAP